MVQKQEKTEQLLTLEQGPLDLPECQTTHLSQILNIYRYYLQ